MKTHTISKTIGGVESSERFLALSIYNGIPKMDHQMKRALKIDTNTPTTTAQRAEDKLVENKPEPTLVCASR